jgi:acetyltransferase-like isoleucine patch superfamily enzyme
MIRNLLKLIHRLLGHLTSIRLMVCFSLRGLDGRVEQEGRLRLKVPLVCDGTGHVQIGSEVCVGYHLAAMLGNGAVRLQARGPHARILVGPGTQFSNNVQVFAENRVTIGARCLIGDAVLIMDSDFHNLSPEGRHCETAATAPVVLEDNVFVGSRVIILKGVTIGKDSVIGAGSVVISSIPSGVIAAGNPAKVIRHL